MPGRGEGSSPGRVDGSSRAMLATARPSCFTFIGILYHLAGDDFVYVDGSNAVDGQHDDEDDDLHTGHPDGEVWAAACTITSIIHHTSQVRFFHSKLISR